MTEGVSAGAEQIASCSCGRLRAVCIGEPARVSVCHCNACKRRTGSAFSWNATFEKDQVTVSGETRRHRRISEEGRWGDHHFCPGCGVVVFYEIEARPGMVSIPAGTFADPAFPEPLNSVYSELRPSWISFRTAVPLTEE
jgi:hypothetical protein